MIERMRREKNRKKDKIKKKLKKKKKIYLEGEKELGATSKEKEKR